MSSCAHFSSTYTKIVPQTSHFYFPSLLLPYYKSPPSLNWTTKQPLGWAVCFHSEPSLCSVQRVKWLQNHKSDHVISLLLTLIASPFIIKLKTPALVYQVLYDLTPGPLSHLLYSLLVFCWLHFSPVGLLHSPLRTCSFALKGKCCSLDTFWSLLKCHFLRETIPNTLFTVAPLSACLLSLQQHSSPAGITQLKRYLINNGLEFSKWAMEEEHSKKRRGSMWCMSECP